MSDGKPDLVSTIWSLIDAGYSGDDIRDTVDMIENEIMDNEDNDK